MTTAEPKTGVQRRCDRAPAALWWGEPYRLFFPLGVLCSLIGVGFWFIKGHVAWMDAVSTQVHVWTQIYGFMGCFVIGFLATAIPRFADAAVFSRREVALLMGLSLASVGQVLAGRMLGAHLAFLLNMAALGLMLLPRFLARSGPLPASFVYIPFGLVAAGVGSAIQAALHLGWDWQRNDLHVFSQALVFQGLILFLILGVGGFLIRSILGWPDPPPAAGAPARARAWEVDLHAACAVALLGTFWLDVAVGPRWGAALRALLVTVEAIGQLRIWRWPRGNKLGAHWLRFAVWLLLLGLWGDAAIAERLPTYRLAFLHLCYAGGFAMITVTVATRVILSHTGFSERLEGRYWPFAVAQSLLLLGAVARLGADFSPDSYHRHLLYAAGCWILGMLVWSAAILIRVAVTRSPPARP